MVRYSAHQQLTSLSLKSKGWIRTEAVIKLCINCEPSCIYNQRWCPEWENGDKLLGSHHCPGSVANMRQLAIWKIFWMTNRVVLHCHLVSVKQNLPSKINSLLYIFSHLTLPNSIILIIVFYLFFKFPLQNEVTNCVRELGHSIDCFWKLVSMDQCTVENWIGLTYIWPDKIYNFHQFWFSCSR